MTNDKYRNTERESIDASRDEFNELSAFQRDILIELVELRFSTEDPYGLAVQSRLEERYGTDINHGRLYPNLDELVQMGFLKKQKLDKRTNKYVLTEDARTALKSRYYEYKSVVDYFEYWANEG